MPERGLQIRSLLGKRLYLTFGAGKLRYSVFQFTCPLGDLVQLRHLLSGLFDLRLALFSLHEGCTGLLTGGEGSVVADARLLTFHVGLTSLRKPLLDRGFDVSECSCPAPLVELKPLCINLWLLRVKRRECLLSLFPFGKFALRLLTFL